MSNLSPPPTSKTWDFRTFKDWFFKLYTRTAGLGPFGSVTGPTGNPADASGYGSGIAMSNGLISDGGGGNTTFIGSGSSTGTSLALMRSTNISGQSIPNATITVVTGWSTEVNTVGSNWVPSTGIFTCPTAGYYLVSGAFLFTSTAWVATAQQEIYVEQNSSTLHAGFNSMSTAATDYKQVQITLILLCAAGDTIKVAAFQTNGAAVALWTDAHFNYFSIVQVQ
jgi:hypothetical protein